MRAKKARCERFYLGYKNSKYFHRRANARRKVNSIEALKDENGKWFFEAEEIKNVAVNFYKILFAESQVFREELVMSVSYPLLPVDVINNIGREGGNVLVTGDNIKDKSKN